MRTLEEQARIEALNQYRQQIGTFRLLLQVAAPGPIEREGWEWHIARLRRQYELERDNPVPEGLAQ
jgi:hypothetical protein